MSYYLPTTQELVKKYQELENLPETEDSKKTKEEILVTLDTMNTALEKMLDKLFLNENWDISAEITVLNQILSMDGLKEENKPKTGGANR